MNCGGGDCVKGRDYTGVYMTEARQIARAKGRMRLFAAKSPNLPPPVGSTTPEHTDSAWRRAENRAMLNIEYRGLRRNPCQYIATFSQSHLP